MSHRTRAFILVAALALSTLSAWAANPLPDGLWRFSSEAELLEAAKGEGLVTSGMAQAVGGRSANDGAIQLAEGSTLRCQPNASVDGGGEAANAYAFLFDVYLTQHGTEQPLLTCNANSSQPQFSITSAGALAINGVTVTGSGLIPTGSWTRIVLSVDMNELNGAINLYVDGHQRAHEEPTWWEAILGGSDIGADGDFSIPSSDQSNPYCLLLSSRTRTAVDVVATTVAFFDEALTDEEVSALATPRKPVLIETVSEATYVTDLSELLALPAAKYTTVFMGNQTLAPDGLRFENLLIDPAGTIVSWDEAYINVIGQVVSIDNLTPATGGYTAQCTWTMPGILGGIGESMEVFIPNNGAIVPEGFTVEIPNFEMGGTEVKNAYVEFYPVDGLLGGGGRIKTPTMDTSVGGSMELRFGIGPEILGYRMPDLTEFGVDVAGLDIPIGEVLKLYEIKAAVANENGLSNPVNLLSTSLSGEFRFIVPPKIPIGGRTIFPLDIRADLGVSLHDGSFWGKGTGTILNELQFAEIDFHYDPPFNAKFHGGFDMILYTGDFGLSSSPGNLAGHFEGKIAIPQEVPVIGGWTLADAKASFHNDHFKGDLSIQITPEIPSICTPQVCFPQICVYWWSCHSTCWAWIFPYPCNCYTQGYCWQPPCIPPICTPAIPAIKVHFGFAYDAGDGSVSFEMDKRARVYNAWETPICSAMKTDGGGTFYFMNNWYTVEAASTNPQGYQKSLAPQKDGSDVTTFTIDETVPAALFRLEYDNASATEVDMQIQLPGGAIVDAADGALPTGFATAPGYSRFNPDNLEQTIILTDPPLGEYVVTVVNPDDLGNYTVDMSLQDHLPSVEITSIEEADVPGSFDIAWEDSDVESVNTVRIYLDEDREGLDGYLVATIEEESNDGDYRLDTTALSAHSGHYFVAIQVDDGINAPIHVYSDDTIKVTPEGAPPAVTNVTYLPDHEVIHVSWDPSTSDDVVGYVVLYTDKHEDLTHFPYRVYVPADTSQLGATVTGLDSNQTYLLTVCAVAENGHRSLPADIIRVTPHAPGADFAPRITSDPDTDATATFQYHYLPQFSDGDLGGTYTWSLDEAPAGMAIDADSGLITWTPEEADAEQDHHVALKIQEDAGDNLSDTQEFNLYVYPSTIGNGLEDHSYAISNHGGMNASVGSDTSAKVFAIEGQTYSHQIHVWGPTDTLRYELLAGPDGMSVDLDGVITWDVPRGAKGQWVRVLVIAEDEHELEHDFYLHVHRNDMAPAQSTRTGCDRYDFCCCSQKSGAKGDPSGLLPVGAALVFIRLPRSLRKLRSRFGRRKKDRGRH